MCNSRLIVRNSRLMSRLRHSESAAIPPGLYQLGWQKQVLYPITSGLKIQKTMYCSSHWYQERVKSSSRPCTRTLLKYLSAFERNGSLITRNVNLKSDAACCKWSRSHNLRYHRGERSGLLIGSCHGCICWCTGSSKMLCGYQSCSYYRRSSRILPTRSPVVSDLFIIFSWQKHSLF